MAKYILKVFGDFTKKPPPKVFIKDTSNKDVTTILPLKINQFKHNVEPFLCFDYNGIFELYPVFVSNLLGHSYDYKITKLN